MHSINAAYCYRRVAWSVRPSVRHEMSPAKTAGPIECRLARGLGWVGPSNHVLDGGPITVKETSTKLLHTTYYIGLHNERNSENRKNTDEDRHAKKYTITVQYIITPCFRVSKSSFPI